MPFLWKLSLLNVLLLNLLLCAAIFRDVLLWRDECLFKLCYNLAFRLIGVTKLSRLIFYFLSSFVDCSSSCNLAFIRQSLIRNASLFLPSSYFSSCALSSFFSRNLTRWSSPGTRLALYFKFLNDEALLVGAALTFLYSETVALVYSSINLTYCLRSFAWDVVLPFARSDCCRVPIRECSSFRSFSLATRSFCCLIRLCSSFCLYSRFSCCSSVMWFSSTVCLGVYSSWVHCAFQSS